MPAPLLRSVCAAALGGLVLASAAASAADQPAVKSSQCAKAERKVAKEEKWEAKGTSTIAQDRRARATCATREICERYDARIKAMETRKARHDARLAKFKGEAAKACSTS